MKLGFVTAIVPELSFADVLELAAGYDYDCVEVMCWPPSKAERRYAGVTHINAAEVDDAKAAEINQLCTDKQVEISALGYYPNPLAADDAESRLAVEHIRRVIDAAGVLGLKTVKLMSLSFSLASSRWPTTGRECSTPGSRWSSMPSSMESGSESRTVPCYSPPTNGPAARTWPPRRPFGGKCSPTWGARRLG